MASSRTDRELNPSQCPAEAGMSEKSACSVTDHITGAAHGMQKRLRETLVDLRAQPGDVHVNNVGLRIKMIVPNVLQQHGTGHDLSRVPHQIFEQAEFARLQLQLLSAAGDFVRETVELEVADPIAAHLTSAATGGSQCL